MMKGNITDTKLGFHKVVAYCLCIIWIVLLAINLSGFVVHCTDSCEILLKMAENKVSKLEADIESVQKKCDKAAVAYTTVSQQQTESLNRCLNQSRTLNEKLELATQERSNIERKFDELLTTRLSVEKELTEQVKNLKKQLHDASKKVTELEEKQCPSAKHSYGNNKTEAKLQHMNVSSKCRRAREIFSREILIETINSVYELISSIATYMTYSAADHIEILLHNGSIQDLWRMISQSFGQYFYIPSFIPEGIHNWLQDLFITSENLAISATRTTIPFLQFIWSFSVQNAISFYHLFEYLLKPAIRSQLATAKVILTPTIDKVTYYLQQLNLQIEPYLQNFYQKYPDIEPLIPKTFLDRLLCAIFILFLFFVFFKFTISILKLVLGVIAHLLCRKLI